MKNKVLVDCLGWCNKKFLSHNPSTNRICKKCKEKMNNKKNEMGKNYFYEKKIEINE
jgi:hypothetical protein